MGNTFADVDESDVDKDPLVLLPCQHIMTTSSLDGWMGMVQAYHKHDPGEHLHSPVRAKTAV